MYAVINEKPDVNLISDLTDTLNYSFKSYSKLYKKRKVTFQVYNKTIDFSLLESLVSKTFNNFEHYIFKLYKKQGLTLPKVGFRGFQENCSGFNHLHFIVMFPPGSEMFLIEKFNEACSKSQYKLRGDCWIDECEYEGDLDKFIQYAERDKSKIDYNQLDLLGTSNDVLENLVINPLSIFGINFFSSRSQFRYLTDATNRDILPYLPEFISLHKEAIASFNEKSNSFKICEKNRPSLIEVREEATKRFDSIIAEDGEDVYLFKAQTGIGKTHLIKNIKLDSIKGKRILIAVERIEMYSEYDYPHYPLVPDSLSKFNDIARKLGISLGTLIYKLNQKNKVLKQVVKDYQEYKSQILSALKQPILVITHSRLLKTDFKIDDYDLIIVDECMSKSIFNTISFDYSEFEILSKFATEYKFFKFEGIKSFLSSLFTSPEGVLCKFDFPDFFLKFFDIYTKLNSSSQISSYLETNEIQDSLNQDSLKWSQLLTSTHYIREGSQIKIMAISKIPIKKMIIMSSSAPDELYKILFQDRLRIINFNPPKLLSNIVQYSDASFSRFAMTSNEYKYKKMIEALRSKSYSVITFKDSILDPDIHFGAETGSNKLKGKHLCVIGTLYPNPSEFKLLCFSLGFDTSRLVNYQESQKIPFNYKSKRLRIVPLVSLVSQDELSAGITDEAKMLKLQIDIMNSSLEQAIGRARPYENYVNILVFSNFNYSESKYMDEDDLVHFLKNQGINDADTIVSPDILNKFDFATTSRSFLI
ncbi:hypothetical protein EHQ94_11160 [Leptospira meyeri]|uniref:DEAD/DEAH box helicase family protein n=1 Tax=Leptospira meyeri TaxID=29508 RepID=UPI001083F9E5|nr:DEAD/DEAH box helicase family protein [Leptospira meyeri]TGM66146.1 hypothetical protein EHQ94_11160 [Leptospira meyeri]